MQYGPYSKRPLNGVGGEPTKAQKVAGDAESASEQDSDQWTCQKCGNLNYGSRLFCNMRQCGAPRSEEPWVCPGCGNENYPTRLFCNLRRCQLARPGLTARNLETAALPQSRTNLGGMSPGFGAVDIRASEPGAWTCPSCGNRNYPGRTHCNAKFCGRAMPQQLPEHPFGGGTGGGLAASRMLMRPSSAPASAGRAAGAGAAPPPGSWLCTACSNVNFPTRTVCNAKQCGQPRAAVDGGYPGNSNVSEAPPGAWVCSSCSNVNWPTRTICNRRSCGLPRPT